MSGLDLYAQAVALYQSGNMTGAAQLCKTMLARTTNQPPLLNLLAAVESALGNNEESVKLTKKLVQKLPSSADAHGNLSLYLQKLEKYEDALKSAERFASLAPQNPNAHYQVALCFRALGKMDSALAAHEKEAPLQNAVITQLHIGDTLYHFTQYENAIAHYEQALAHAPDAMEVLHNLSLALQRAGRHEEALACNLQLLQRMPDSPEAHLARGSILQELKQLDQAVTHYQKALAGNPRLFDAQNNMGSLMQKFGLFEQAIPYCRAALALNPKSATAHDNLANALIKTGQTEEAMVAYETAITLDQNSAAIHSDYASALVRVGRYDDAQQAYKRALGLNPELPDIHANKGWLNQQLGNYGAAIRDYNAALALEPDHAPARFSKATHLLLHGEMIQGWAMYESRFEDGQSMRRFFNMPKWEGQDLSGKTLLIHAEQGLGDTIQFCRYVKLLAAKGARCILEVPCALTRVMQTLEGPAHIINPHEKAEADYYIPLLSVPRILDTILQTIPAETPYLSAPAPLLLPTTTRKRIGLAWSGSNTHVNDRNRSIPLAQLAPLLAKDVEFHCLQTEIRPSDRAAFDQSGIIMHQLSDMADTAALIAAMDVVISVDTAPAHLAGALAKSLYILLPFSPDFRWLLQRRDSPWYPTAQLLRQPAIGDWQTPIQELVSTL